MMSLHHKPDGCSGQMIVMEGVEGAGKTTNLQFLRDLMVAHNLHPLVTREPGGTQLGERLRDVLLHFSEEPIEPMAELLMLCSARYQHVTQKILPSLRAGRWVLCDRFVDATYAYQGGGRGFDVSVIECLDRMVLADFKPDWVIFLDLPCQQGAERVDARGVRDRFEQEALGFFERVREVYLARARREVDRYTVINASQPLAAVQADIRRAFEARYIASVGE